MVWISPAQEVHKISDTKFAVKISWVGLAALILSLQPAPNILRLTRFFLGAIYKVSVFGNRMTANLFVISHL
jgi:hypothetical protein